MEFLARNHWIFDLDGTLTIAIHDFDAIRERLGLPLHEPILEALERLPVDRARYLHGQLDSMELELARQALPQSGAKFLLEHLQRRGSRLGILTRNSERNAFETLRVCGLLEFFEAADILGRESASPKPSPEGVHRLLSRWGATADSAVVVGDYVFDIEAGQAAGTATIYVNGDDEATPTEVDVKVSSLSELEALMRVHPG
jgi:HAD superfamily hydrolase (TIGR01509 family)